MGPYNANLWWWFTSIDSILKKYYMDSFHLYRPVDGDKLALIRAGKN